jgi:hypothetical protein
MKASVVSLVDARVQKIADEHIAPRVATLIDSTVLQETTKWGERKGEPLTFCEYLVARAQSYMMDEVNWDGVTKAEGGYAWQKHSTRLTTMVHRHLHARIEEAVKGGVAVVNATLADGINAAVKVAIEQVTAGIKVAISMPR